jgi:hypothetical protein
MALRMRRSRFISEYLASQGQEDQIIQEAIDALELDDPTGVDR